MIAGMSITWATAELAARAVSSRATHSDLAKTEPRDGELDGCELDMMVGTPCGARCSERESWNA
jgi:hypothetical protein